MGERTTFAVGVRFDDRTKSVDERLLELNSAAQFTAAGIPTNYGQIAIPGGFQGEIPLGYTFQYFGKGQILDLVDRAKTIGTYRDQFANLYDVNERIYSAYAMATVTTGWGNVIGGARVEHIRNRSSAFVNGNAATPLTIDRDITLVYPSLHLNYDVNDRMKARLSFNTGAARPDYDQLAPNLSFNDANLTISGGNPDAKPEKAMGVDAYVEYYVAPAGFLSFGAYYKRLRDVLFDTTRTFNSDVLNANGVDRSQYLYSAIANGGTGSIIGIEGAIQQQLDPFVADLGLPDWMGGFGVQLNATLNRSRAETPDGGRVQLPGASDAVYNIGAYYEKYGFSARVQYQNRSRWLDDLGSTADGGDFYWAKDDELDASLRYAVNRNVELFGNFSNLLNGPGRRYVRETRYTIERESFGRRYQLENPTLYRLMFTPPPRLGVSDDPWSGEAGRQILKSFARTSTRISHSTFSSVLSTRE
nr:TonB-dependent receptor [Sphingomonas sp. ABOLH]